MGPGSPLVKVCTYVLLVSDLSLSRQCWHLMVGRDAARLLSQILFG